MVDLVGTFPKDFFLEWIAEGDAAGDPPTGEEWGWYTRDSLALQAKPGDRFYVVAHGLLRGWAPVTRVQDSGDSFVICRRGDAVACAIDVPVPGFRGLRTRWWDRSQEKPFPDWTSAGLPEPKRKKIAAAPLLDQQIREAHHR